MVNWRVTWLIELPLLILRHYIWYLYTIINIFNKNGLKFDIAQEVGVWVRPKWYQMKGNVAGNVPKL